MKPRKEGRRIASRAVGLLVLAHALGQTAAASEDQTKGQRAVFALIIGVNSSPRAGVAPLHYADDDAARYLDLFRALGARSYVLSRLDESTRQLHPQAAAEAAPPRLAELHSAVAAVSRDIEQARTRGVASTFYVVYAGHGDVDDSRWFLTLEDGRISDGQLLGDVVQRAGADQSHVIVDACHAYMLALPRGPGGTRRPVQGFVELEAAARSGRTGYLLSSSTSGETHEWAGFEAGVFSHEVRSGLYGAADADGDGMVTYAEIGAFVSRANQAIVSDRFRPQVLARPARGYETLVDLSARRERALKLEAAQEASHYLVENAHGVRLLDFHNAGLVQLMRPPGEGPLYLRRVRDGAERTIPWTDGAVDLDLLPESASRARIRGAAHHAFSKIFALPFGSGTVATWQSQAAEVEAEIQASLVEKEKQMRRTRLLRIGGVSALGLGVAAAVAAGIVAKSAHDLADEAPQIESHRDAVARNQRIDARNRGAVGLGIGAALVGVTGALLLLWPEGSSSGPTRLDAAWSGSSGWLRGYWAF